ncbi:MAG: DUF3592 domain-containing protein [Xanthomonadaceae bacterium]|nr:DUF3592 domain-containing protein [Xanthomonadaceae bacterium]
MTRAGLTACALIVVIASGLLLSMYSDKAFNWIPVAVGISLVSWALFWFRRYRQARTWMPVEAQVLKIMEKSRGVRIGVGLYLYVYPSVTFRYEVHGQTYMGGESSVEIENIWVPDYERTSAFWADWADGKRITAVYNPTNPKQAMLMTELSKSRLSHHAAVLSAGLLVLVLGVILL